MRKRWNRKRDGMGKEMEHEKRENEKKMEQEKRWNRKRDGT